METIITYTWGQLRVSQVALLILVGLLTCLGVSWLSADLDWPLPGAWVLLCFKCLSFSSTLAWACSGGKQKGIRDSKHWAYVKPLLASHPLIHIGQSKSQGHAQSQGQGLSPCPQCADTASQVRGCILGSGSASYQGCLLSSLSK